MDGGMPSLDDLVADLWNGTKKIEVPKSQVTEPIEGWKSSKYALPEPGSKGSMRKGRLHAHDHGDSWEVHLDHYDPDAHPVKHLIVDAPVLVFLTHIMIAAGKGAGKQLEAAAEEGLLIKYRSRRNWGSRLALGAVLTFLALFMLVEPGITLGVVEMAITLALFAFGAMTIYSALSEGAENANGVRLTLGLLLVVFGILSFLFPDLVFALFLIFLAIWMVITSYFLLRGRTKGVRGLEGTGTLLLGLVSLFIGFLTILDVNFGALFLLYFLALIVLAFGISQILFAFRCRTLPCNEAV
jgi:uncharacterized membrane protein HdeD (DUF308 family)